MPILLIFKNVLNITQIKMSQILYSAVNAESFVKHLLRIFDLDGNGFLDFKEFLVAMDISRCSSGNIFDLDGNGFLDFKEFLLAIHVTSSGSTEEKLSWAFR